VRHIPQFAFALVVVLLAGLVAKLRLPDPQAGRVARADSVAFTLAVAYKNQRTVTDSVTRRAKTAEWQEVVARRSARASRDTLTHALDSARAVLADTLADVSTLYTTLRGLTEVADNFRLTVITHEGTVDSLVAAHSAERREWLVERQAADSLLAAKDSVIVALRPSCRILGPIPCPSRKAAFGAGVVLTLGAVVLLAR
jgi:hypothetical protein